MCREAETEQIEDSASSQLRKNRKEPIYKLQVRLLWPDSFGLNL